MKSLSLKTVLVVLLLVLAAVSVGLSTFFQSLRLDESQSIWVALKPIPTLIRLTAQDVHVPLYFVLLHFWIKFFGSGIYAVRSLSFIFYILTLVVFYRLVRLAAARDVALLSLVLFSLSPFMIWYSLEARMYTLLTFVSTLSHLLFLQFLRSQGRGRAGLLLSALLGFYTHYFFVFLFASQLLYLLWRQRGLLLPFLLQSALAVALFLPWVGYVFSLGAASTTQPLIPTPGSFNLLQLFAVFLFGFHDPVLEGLLVAFWPLGALMILLVFTQRMAVEVENLDYFLLSTFLPILLVFVLSIIFKPIFLARYLIFTIPSWFVLLSFALLNFPPKVSRLLIPTVVVVMLIFLFYQNFSKTTPVKEDYQTVVSYINQNATPSDVVAVSAPFTIYPVEYYYTGRAKVVTIPIWDRFVQGSIPPFDEGDLKQQFQGYQGQYRRVFVALSYDQGYEAKIRDYLDHNFDMERSIKYSPGLQLRIYRLR